MIMNTEFVRELGAGEMEAIYELTHTEEEHEALLQHLLAMFRDRRRGSLDAEDGVGNG
ncbi:MAG: hypothetical protein IID35_10465 [Planctomycetes bacterium]|nr:hypothetical protein [Planctomycetota bacterium]